jgi:ABC-type branched-subunit amino acid transport system ATPase component/ABC-type branched-subunit amino acid transport system permease subunit
MTMAAGARGDPSQLNSWKFDYLAPILVFLLFLGILGLVENHYLARLVALVIFWAALATTWNWVGGYTGQLSLGHAAFVGLGAYLGYALEKEFGIPPWYAMCLAIPLGAIAAVVIGAPTLRLSGVFFSLATVVFPLTLQIFFTYWGYQEALIPAKPNNPFLYMQWEDPRAYAILFGSLLLIYWFATVALTRSRWRYYLAAIRQDQIAAASVGINTWVVKLIVFVLSGSAACVLGVAYAQMLFVVTPETVFGINISLQAMVLCLVGGIGRSYGAILGTLIVIPMTQALEARFESNPGVPQLVYGIMLIIVILLIPNGVVARLKELPWLAGMRRTRDNKFSDASFSSPAIVETGGRPFEPAVLHTGGVLLKAEGLRMSYGGVVAVNDVSFDIPRGQFLGIVGPNGAGKTTLFDLLTGFQRPTSGQIQLEGTAITNLRPYQLARMGLRRTFQVPRPFPLLSVYENVLLGTLTVRERTKDNTEEATWRTLDSIGLAKRASSPAGLSTPSQIRLLEVARAVVAQPKILLLDEPLAGLDPSETHELIEILQKLHRSGLTILIVDHAIGMVARVVERMVVLNNGAIIADGSPDQITHLPRVVEAYLGTRWQDA